jgi:hypothetical protein
MKDGKDLNKLHPYRVDTFREITSELGPIKCDLALTDSVNRQSSKYT